MAVVYVIRIKRTTVIRITVKCVWLLYTKYNQPKKSVFVVFFFMNKSEPKKIFPTKKKYEGKWKKIEWVAQTKRLTKHEQ